MLSLSAPCQYSHFRILDQLMVFQYFNLNELMHIFVADIERHILVNNPNILHSLTGGQGNATDCEEKWRISQFG